MSPGYGIITPSASGPSTEARVDAICLMKYVRVTRWLRVEVWNGALCFNFKCKGSDSMVAALFLRDKLPSIKVFQKQCSWSHYQWAGVAVEDKVFVRLFGCPMGWFGWPTILLEWL